MDSNEAYKKFVYDVFIGENAQGNPCGVVVLTHWLADAELLAITQDIDQPVTSFIVEKDGQFFLRWFSKTGEINLCGHGSLGAGAVVLSHYKLDSVVFDTKHGQLTISLMNGLYRIELPSWSGNTVTLPDCLSELNANAVETFATRDLVVVLASPNDVANFKPNIEKISMLSDYHALIVTARSSDQGYVLRYFAPSIGIDEDSATGSAQCSLAPYWFSKLGAESLYVKQLSEAGGYFEVEKCRSSSVAVLAKVKVRR